MSIVKNVIGNSAIINDVVKTNKQMSGAYSTYLTMPNGEKVAQVIAGVAISTEVRQAQENCNEIKRNVKESLLCR